MVATRIGDCPEIPIDAHQAQAIARGLYAVAAAGGVHEREAALIANFYGATADEDARPLTSLAELARLEALAPADTPGPRSPSNSAAARLYATAPRRHQESPARPRTLNSLARALRRWSPT